MSTSGGGGSLSSLQQQPRIRLLSKAELHINKVTHSDSGSIFQCYVSSDFESAQASLQLRLLSEGEGEIENESESNADSQEDSKEMGSESWHHHSHQQRLRGKLSQGGHRSERDSGLSFSLKFLQNFKFFNVFLLSSRRRPSAAFRLCRADTTAWSALDVKGKTVLSFFSLNFSKLVIAFSKLRNYINCACIMLCMSINMYTFFLNFFSQLSN